MNNKHRPLEDWSPQYFSETIKLSKFYTTKSTAHALLWCLTQNNEKECNVIGDIKNSTNIQILDSAKEIESYLNVDKIQNYRVVHSNDFVTPKEWKDLVWKKIMQGNYKVLQVHSLNMTKDQDGVFMVSWKEEIKVYIMVEKYSGRVK